MQVFSLKLDSKINGIYLNTETIELLNIIQCKSVEELKDFVSHSEQLKFAEKNSLMWSAGGLESIKRNLIEKYKSTLVPRNVAIKDRNKVLEAAFEHSGIEHQEVDSYIETFHKHGYEGIKEKLLNEHPEEYGEFTEKAHRFIVTERDQMRSVTYDELLAINSVLHNHNTILLCGGRYHQVTKKMYDERIPNMKKYDFYCIQRNLDFCYKNGMHARYHTLLDKQTMEEHFIGKPKEYVLKELEGFVKNSIDFISQYNDEHKINGKGVICSVDLFNEIISFDEPYRNRWQELYGISNEELVNVYRYALENKPENVTYVYNEPFLENSKRREVVIEQLSKINELAPGLIDTIGTQMHIELTQNMGDIKHCFEELKKLESLGIQTQITEFDMCLPERFMFDENGKARSEQALSELVNSKMSNPSFKFERMAVFKLMKMNEVSKAIKETGINLEGVTYWSIDDTLDHNLQRTNEKTCQYDLPRDIATTRYSGLYSAFERKRDISISRNEAKKAHANTKQITNVLNNKTQNDAHEI